MNTDPAKQAWQASVEIAGAPPLEDVRKGAKKFYRFVWWRNAVEYVAAAVAIVVFTYQAFVMPHILHKLGCILIVAASIYGPWQLHRRASAVAPEMAGTMPIYTFLRGQLVRQRDALRTIFGWYMLPFFPGLALLIIGNGVDSKIEAAGPPIWQRWVALGVMAAIFAGIWWANRYVARRLQRRIDEIDALTGAA